MYSKYGGISSVEISETSRNRNRYTSSDYDEYDDYDDGGHYGWYEDTYDNGVIQNGSEYYYGSDRSYSLDQGTTPSIGMETSSNFTRQSSSNFTRQSSSNFTRGVRNDHPIHTRDKTFSSIGCTPSASSFSSSCSSSCSSSRMRKKIVNVSKINVLPENKDIVEDDKNKKVKSSDCSISGIDTSIPEIETKPKLKEEISNLSIEETATLSVPKKDDSYLYFDGVDNVSKVLKVENKKEGTDINSVIYSMDQTEMKDLFNSETEIPKSDYKKCVYNPSYEQKLDFPKKPDKGHKIPPSGRIILVIGGFKGIGLSTATYLGRKGFKVIATSSHPETYEKIKLNDFSELKTGKKGVFYCSSPIDIRLEDSVKSFFEQFSLHFEFLDGLILFSGVKSVGKTTSYTGDDLRDCIDLKLVGYHRCIKNSYDILHKGNNPIVLATSSINESGKIPRLFSAPCSISNTGVQNLMENLMMEERYMYSVDEVKNPIVFSTLFPTICTTTYSLYQFQKPRSETKDNKWVDASHSVSAASYSGLMSEGGTSSSSPICVSRDILNILTTKFPNIEYLVGDKDQKFPGPKGYLNFKDLIQTLSSMSRIDVLNFYTCLETNFYDKESVEYAKEILRLKYSKFEKEE